MRIFNLWVLLVALGFEIFLNLVLGMNPVPREQFTDDVDPNVDSSYWFSRLFPTFRAIVNNDTETTANKTAAPANIRCFFDPRSDAACKACPNGTSGGTIQSPYYPDDFAEKKFSCAYAFSASTGKQIKFTLASGSNGIMSEFEGFIFADVQLGMDIVDSVNITFPTTTINTYNTNGTDGAFITYSSGNRSCTGACQWEFTFEPV